MQRNIWLFDTCLQSSETWTEKSLPFIVDGMVNVYGKEDGATFHRALRLLLWNKTPMESAAKLVFYVHCTHIQCVSHDASQGCSWAILPTCHTNMAVHFGCYNKIPCKQQKSVFYSPRGWGIQDQCANRFCVGYGPCTWWKRGTKDRFCKTLIPFTRAPPSWPNELIKVSPINTNALEKDFNKRILGVTQTFRL